MLKKSDLTRIAAIIGITADEFTTAIKAEDEQELTIPAVFTESEAKANGETKFKAGRKAEKEIAAKELAKALEVEIETKDIKLVAETYATKMVTAAKLPADEQVSTLKAEKATLQGLVTAGETKLTEAMSTHNNQLFQFELKQSIAANIPEKTSIPKTDVTDLFMLKHDITKDADGNTIISKGGAVMNDKLENPVKLAVAVKEFSESYLTKPNLPGGGGGGKLPDKFTKLSEAAQWAHENNVIVNSDKFNEVLAKRKAENFEFDTIPTEYL